MTWGALIRRAARQTGWSLLKWAGPETTAALPSNVTRIDTYCASGWNWSRSRANSSTSTSHWPTT